MSNSLSSLAELIEALLILPGIGRRTAERFAYAFLEGSPAHAKRLATALNDLHNHVIVCQRCGQFANSDPCDICKDPKRNQNELIIVASGRDIKSFEQMKLSQGLYFALGGLLNPIEGITPERLRLRALFERLKEGEVKEVIIALNPIIEGDTTALYLVSQLKQFPVRISRLARGLSTGSRLDYADEMTLRSAYSNREKVSG